MPHVSSNGVRLYYEEAGKGTALVFVHEFSGDLRTWEAQMRFFSRRYRCIAFNARGYPPSEVPRSPSKYSYTAAVDDIANVMRHLAVGKAHIIGCSMGAYATLHFGLRYPRRARSLTAIGTSACAIRGARVRSPQSAPAPGRTRRHTGNLSSRASPRRVNSRSRVSARR